MRTFEMSESGRIALVEEPKPTPGTGQVLMRVHATSLNARDLFMLDGRYPVPLSDAAGVVEATGPGVTRFRAGDRGSAARSASPAGTATRTSAGG